MPGRSRTTIGPVIAGRYFKFAWSSYASYQTSSLVTDDITGTRGPPYIAENAFTSTRRINRVKPMKNVSSQLYTDGNYYPTALRPLISFLSAAEESSGLSTAFTNRILARSNPSKPAVDLPVFVGELGDLPKLVELAGKSILRYENLAALSRKIKRREFGELVASGNLNYQLGWAPLISDLQKLRNFSEHVAAKQRVIEKLAAGEGLRRRVNLDSWTLQGGPFANQSVESAYVTVSGSFTDYHEGEVWATTRWIPDRTQLPSFSDPTLAWRAAFGVGLSATPSVIWELVPFSFVVDYFSDVGDFLAARRNTVPAVFAGGSVMKRRYTRRVWKPMPGYEYAWDGGEQIVDIRLRRPITATVLPTASLDFLSLKQLSILGSLTVLQASAWGRR